MAAGGITQLSRGIRSEGTPYALKWQYSFILSWLGYDSLTGIKVETFSHL